MSSNGNIYRVTGPLCVEFTGHRWISLPKASDAELWRFFDLRLNKWFSKQLVHVKWIMSESYIASLSPELTAIATCRARYMKLLTLPSWLLYINNEYITWFSIGWSRSRWISWRAIDKQNHSYGDWLHHIYYIFDVISFLHLLEDSFT